MILAAGNASGRQQLLIIELQGVIYGDGRHFTATFSRQGSWHFYDDLRNRMVQVEEPAVQNASYLFYRRAKVNEDTHSLSVPTVLPGFREGRSSEKTKIVRTVGVLNVRNDCH